MRAVILDKPAAIEKAAVGPQASTSPLKAFRELGRKLHGTWRRDVQLLR